MPTETLQIGETVQLKSGGPLMTITAVGERYLTEEQRSISTSWFEDTHHHYATFPMAALQRRSRADIKATEVPGAARKTPGNVEQDCG